VPGERRRLSVLVTDAGKARSAFCAGDAVCVLLVAGVCAGVVVCATVALAQPVVFVLLVNVRIEHTAATCESAGDSVRQIGCEAGAVREGESIVAVVASRHRKNPFVRSAASSPPTVYNIPREGPPVKENNLLFYGVRKYELRIAGVNL